MPALCIFFNSFLVIQEEKCLSADYLCGLNYKGKFVAKLADMPSFFKIFFQRLFIFGTERVRA